jgi:hypothetical protein
MASLISARKMREWMVYAELEPFGSSAQFWQSGVVASTIANVNRTKKSQKAFSPEDFMPSTMKEEDEPQEPQDVTEQVVRAFREMEQIPRG